MLIFFRRVDEWIRIGQHIKLWPTDIDAHGVRLLIDGEILGGADDGSRVRKAYEMTIGSIVPFGPQVSIHLLDVRDGVAQLGISSNRTLTISTSESEAK
jgi:sRNA-binding carbon storage regulator CsrA